MLARMEGIWHASGEVVVMLDSHIETTPGWLEPMLARIGEDRTRVVTPRIDAINTTTMDYISKYGIEKMGFTWMLDQSHMSADGSDSFQRSPTMAGGLFASNRAMFLHLGGYDPDMHMWGGEEMEIGLRTWQCGGSIEYSPCSHVGHLYRNSAYWTGFPYKVDQAQIVRNKLRAVEVWLDEYKSLVSIAGMHLPKGLTLGSLEERKAMRKRLGCKSMKWYLTNVFPELFAPKLDGSSHIGALGNPRWKTCIDALSFALKEDMQAGVYPCHGEVGGAQGFILDDRGRLRSAQSSFKFCLAVSGTELRFRACDKADVVEKDLLWRWDAVSGHLATGSTRLEQCLEATSPNHMTVTDCDEEAEGQVWRWKNLDVLERSEAQSH